jgi:hypothetical protein
MARLTQHLAWRSATCSGRRSKSCKIRYRRCTEQSLQKLERSRRVAPQRRSALARRSWQRITNSSLRMMRVSSHCTPTQNSPQLKRLEILVSFLLYKRDEEVQKAFWRSNLWTYHDRCRHSVSHTLDERLLSTDNHSSAALGSGTLRQLWNYRAPRMCMYIHHHIVARAIVEARLKLQIKSLAIRQHVKMESMEKKCMDLIF